MKWIFLTSLMLMACGKTETLNVTKTALPVGAPALDVSKDSYHQPAYHITPTGKVITGADSILMAHQSNRLPDEKIAHRDTMLWTQTNKAIAYEIGQARSSTGRIIKHLIVWRVGDTHTRELEVTALSTPFSVDISELDSARAAWMRYCNAHDVKGLVDTMYMPHAVYYYHRSPPVVGRENLYASYSYMNRETYSLTLHPMHVEVVTNKLVFEIGYCTGSYGDKYVLVWVKTGTGWQIVMDSNT